MQLSDFHNLHKGETCVITGVGPNLKLTPPTWFNYPTFGINTIYKQTEWDWKPTYFVGVDIELLLRDSREIVKVYRDIPKFFPSPDWDKLQGENIYRFQHRPGSTLYIGGQAPNQKDSLLRFGITYRRIMEAVCQVAWWMGFTTMLLIGVHHKPGTRKEHIWGMAEYEAENDFLWEEIGYREIVNMMNGVRVLNISADTYVPENILPRDDWQKWKNA